MDNEIFWDDEMVTDNDEAIVRLEAELTEGKAFLALLAVKDDLF